MSEEVLLNSDVKFIRGWKKGEASPMTSGSFWVEKTSMFGWLEWRATFQDFEQTPLRNHGNAKREDNYWSLVNSSVVGSYPNKKGVATLQNLFQTRAMLTENCAYFTYVLIF